MILDEAHKRVQMHVHVPATAALRTSLLLCLVISLINIAACTLVADAPVPVSLIRSPLTFREIEDVNAPINPDDRDILGRIGDAMDNGEDRTQAAKSEEPKLQHEQFANLEGRHEHALAFVTFSGGGAPAAAFAAHTMSLLEQRYNEILIEYAHRHDNTFDFCPMMWQLDAVSSVSGGSIYAFAVATSYLEKEDQQALSLLQNDPYVLGSWTDRCGWGSLLADDWTNFQYLARGYEGEQVHFAVQNFGTWSAANYFLWPLEPLATFFMDENYLDEMALNLDYRSISSHKLCSPAHWSSRHRISALQDDGSLELSSSPFDVSIHEQLKHRSAAWQPRTSSVSL